MPNPLIQASLENNQPDLPAMPQVDLTQAQLPNLPSQGTIEDRANKASMGLGDIVGKDKEGITQDLMAGRENTLRQQAASTLNAQSAKDRHDKLLQLTSLMSEGVNIPDDTFRRLLDNSIVKPVDPDTVIERSYGHAVTSSLEGSAIQMDSPAWKNSNTYTPGFVQNTKDKTSLLASQQAFINTLSQNVSDKLSQDSWWNYGKEMAMQNIPGVSTIHEMNIHGLGGTSSILPQGASFDAFADHLFSLPMDQFKGELTKALEPLNPYQQREVLEAIQGQSTSQRVLNNLGTFGNLAMFPGVPMGSKFAFRALKDLGTVESAAKSVVKAAAEPNVTKAALSNAAGDVESAAVDTAVTMAKSDLKGTQVIDPIQTARQELTSNFNVDIKDVQANPGRFGNELANRIKERGQQVIDDIFGKLQTGLKVDRTPELKASPEVQKMIMEDIKKDYVGLDNSLLDVRGPHWDRLTNTYWFEHVLGHYDGTLFQTSEQAVNFAKENGLALAEHGPAATQTQERIAQLEELLKEPPTMEADAKELQQRQLWENELATKRETLSEFRRNADGYMVDNQGFGFYISKWKPLNENSPIMRDAFAQTDYDKVFQPGWLKTAVGWLRTPEEVLSTAENDQRHIATFGPNRLIEGLRDASKEIEKLPRKYWDEWNRTVDAARKMYDENGKIGYFMKSPGEMEEFYLSNFSRLPEKPEIEAYFAFKRNVELDRVMREIQEFRNRARLGSEQHTLTIKGPNGEKLSSNTFDGIKQREFPHGDDTVAVMSPDKATVYANGSSIPKKIQADLMEKVKRGEKAVLRVYDPDSKPLAGFGGIKDTDRVRYIITDMYESKPLQFNHVERRGGGHFAWDYDNYIKQAKINKEVIGKGSNVTIRHWYLGDNTIMPVAIRKMGEEVLKHMNNVRELIKGNKLEDAEAYNNTNLHIPWDTHLKWYKSGQLDANLPLHLVPNNKKILDVDNSLAKRFSYVDKRTGETKYTFRDGTRSGSDARQYQVDYVNPRDSDTMYTLNDVGGRHNPLYQYEPAKMVDPIVTMNRALNRVSNGMYLDDMKIYSVEHWLREAAPHLDIKPGEERYNPFGTFTNATWKSGADPIRTSNLDSAKAKINHFLGTYSRTDAYMQSVSQRLVDSIYGKMGPKAALLSNAALMKTRDPLAFMRTVTFHLKLGMFNAPQFFTQLMTASNILGIAGYRPWAGGTMGTYFHYLAGFNNAPEILDHIDGLATKFKFPGAYTYRPGDWREAYEFVKRTGFEILGHEVSMLDTPFSAKIIQNGMNKFLDAGEFFFRKGAQNTRLSAAYTAYLEHRAENPGPLTRADEESILSRASLLDHNMNRSANSALHTGIMAPAAQFAAYSLRLMELMTGKRLTTMEKTRLFGTSSILYGVPLGGIGLFGWPAGDYIRQKFEEGSVPGFDAYAPGKNIPMTVFQEGAPAVLYATLTGAIKNSKDGTQWDLASDARKGDYLNFHKWGPEAYQILEKGLTGDASVWDIGGGASFGTLRDMWRLSSPLRYWASTFVFDHENAYPLTADDVFQAARVWSAYNHYWQAKSAWETGRWLSMNDVYLEDVDKFNAVVQGVTGLSPVNVADITLSRASIEQRDEGYKNATQAALLQIRRGLQAVSNEDPEQADAYFKAAKAITRFMPVEMQNQVARRALDENLPLVDRLKQDYFIKKAPIELQEKFMNFYQGWQELNQQRRGK